MDGKIVAIGFSSALEKNVCSCPQCKKLGDGFNFYSAFFFYGWFAVVIHLPSTGYHYCSHFTKERLRMRKGLPDTLVIVIYV